MSFHSLRGHFPFLEMAIKAVPLLCHDSWTRLVGAPYWLRRVLSHLDARLLYRLAL